MHVFLFLLLFNGSIEIARFNNPSYYKIKEIKLEKAKKTEKLPSSSFFNVPSK